MGQYFYIYNNTKKEYNKYVLCSCKDNRDCDYCLDFIAKFDSNDWKYVVKSIYYNKWNVNDDIWIQGDYGSEFKWLDIKKKLIGKGVWVQKSFPRIKI